jgi:hypothetical protein
MMAYPYDFFFSDFPADHSATSRLHRFIEKAAPSPYE